MEVIVDRQDDMALVVNAFLVDDENDDILVKTSAEPTFGMIASATEQEYLEHLAEMNKPLLDRNATPVLYSYADMHGITITDTGQICIKTTLNELLSMPDHKKLYLRMFCERLGFYNNMTMNLRTIGLDAYEWAHVDQNEPITMLVAELNPVEPAVWQQAPLFTQRFLEQFPYRAWHDEAK